MTLKETLEGIRNWAAIAALFAGSVFASEKSGLTDVFVDYCMMKHQAYHEVHQRAPLLVWEDPGNPKQDPTLRTRYRIANDIEFGLMSTLIGGVGIALGADAIRKRKAWNPYRQGYDSE